MDEVRGEVRQRDEDEGALVQARVGEGQPGDAEDEVIVKEDVHVNQARAPAYGCHAAEISLEVFEMFEEGGRLQVRFGAHDHVQEGGLVGDAPGRGLVNGRRTTKDDGGRQSSQGRVQIGKAVAEVGAEGEVDG